MIKNISHGSQKIVAAYLNNELIYSAGTAKYSPLSLFANAALGAWYEAIDAATLFQDAARSAPAKKMGDPVGAVLDKSGNGWHATQSISARRPTYEQAPDRLQLDRVDDEIVINMPSKFEGTMVLATTMGTASYGVSIPAGDFKLGGKYFPSNDIVGVLFRDGELTNFEQDSVEGYFVENGAVADYSAVTDFSYFWYTQSRLTSFPSIDTSSATDFVFTWGNCSSLTSFPLLDTSNATNLIFAWSGCSSLTSFPLIDTSQITSFNNTWNNCSSLTSFPLIDTSNAKSFSSAWRGCSSLTRFPSIDTSSATDFVFTWYSCTSLTSFPLIDTSNAKSFSTAWRGCSSLTSFPSIDTSSGTNFSYAWFGCSSLTDFPAHAFDNVKGGDFNSAFTVTNLNQDSIDGILVSLVASGIASGTRRFDQSGGSAPSSIGNQAIDTLRTRGWAIAVTGGY